VTLVADPLTRTLPRPTSPLGEVKPEPETNMTLEIPRTKREIGWAFLLALGVQTAGAFLWA